MHVARVLHRVSDPLQPDGKCLALGRSRLAKPVVNVQRLARAIPDRLAYAASRCGEEVREHRLRVPRADIIAERLNSERLEVITRRPFPLRDLRRDHLLGHFDRRHRGAALVLVDLGQLTGKAPRADRLPILSVL